MQGTTLGDIMHRYHVLKSPGHSAGVKALSKKAHARPKVHMHTQEAARGVDTSGNTEKK